MGRHANHLCGALYSCRRNSLHRANRYSSRPPLGYSHSDRGNCRRTIFPACIPPRCIHSISIRRAYRSCGSLGPRSFHRRRRHWRRTSRDYRVVCDLRRAAVSVAVSRFLCGLVQLLCRNCWTVLCCGPLAQPLAFSDRRCPGSLNRNASQLRRRVVHPPKIRTVSTQANSIAKRDVLP